MQQVICTEAGEATGTDGGKGKQRRQSRPATDGISAANLLTVLESQNYQCALTGRVLTPDSASVDHAMPLSKGGEHAISNVQILHTDVNQAKGVMTTAEFIAMCREVVAHADGSS